MKNNCDCECSLTATNETLTKKKICFLQRSPALIAINSLQLIAKVALIFYWRERYGFY